MTKVRQDALVSDASPRARFGGSSRRPKKQLEQRIRELERENRRLRARRVRETAASLEEEDPDDEA